jgi:hypothetical protein
MEVACFINASSPYPITSNETSEVLVGYIDDYKELTRSSGKNSSPNFL